MHELKPDESSRAVSGDRKIPDDISEALADLGLSDLAQYVDIPETDELPAEDLVYGPMTKAEAEAEAEDKEQSQEDEEETKDEYRERTFLRVGSDAINQPIVVRDSSTIGKNFHTIEGCVVGRESVIGDNCSVASPVGKKVFIGDDTNISVGGRIGTVNLENWGYTKEKVVDGETVKEFIEFETKIGSNVTIENGVYIKPNSTIGDGVTIKSCSKIGHVIRDDKVRSKMQTVKPTIIAPGCVVGEDVIIEAGVQISEGYIVADGVRMTSDIITPPNVSGETILIDNDWIDKYKFNQRREAREKAQEKQ